MKTDDLREAYLSFFESKGCVRKPSDVLVPNDQSVLFTPAGMNQFKEQFLGIGKLEFTKATTCQLCIRTGDIENVGVTARHMTLFEMLGNFSFGDYFKQEAIHWGWEFCTKVLGLKPEVLSVSIYLDDDEAERIWTKEIGLPSSKIRRMDEHDNFWPAGAPSNGPDGVCGPCSEIFADIGTEDVEIWNLVFTQFNRVGAPPNNLHPLPAKNIDTGMGLERTAAVLQGVPTVFDIDIFKPIMQLISETTKVKYEHGTPEASKLRRLADHTRAATFCLHENVIPSAEKQGYVLRRLIRRALVDAWKLGVKEPVLHKFVPAIVDAMKKPYPELKQTAKSVADRLRLEEEGFLVTLERGMRLMNQQLSKLDATGSKTLSGNVAFDFNQTHGFPLEITKELAAERGVTVDEQGYNDAKTRHAETSGRGAFANEVFAVGPIQKIKSKVAPTQFDYTATTGTAKIVGIVAKGDATDGPVTAETGDIVLVLDKTVFYGESGGQVGDVGTISTDSAEFAVGDTKKTDGYHQHGGKVIKGSFKVGDTVKLAIDADRRAGITRAHSATHMLHAALHQVIGHNANQAGSKVERDVLRFDFTHGHAVSSSELAEVEQIVNRMIMGSSAIDWQVKPIEEAKKMGAMALFGEKYGDQVRVVSMGDFSREFCGGCHLSNTGQAGMVKIVREESVSAGVRRITAYTGPMALEHIQHQERVLAQSAGLLRVSANDLASRIEALQAQIKDLQKSASSRQSSDSGAVADTLLSSAFEIADGKGLAIVGEVKASSTDEIRNLADQIRAKSKNKDLAILLASTATGKVEIVAMVADNLTKTGLAAGKWLGEVAKVVGGKGGGRPNLAQGGGTDVAKLSDALEVAKQIVKPA